MLVQRRSLQAVGVKHAIFLNEVTEHKQCINSVHGATATTKK